MKKKTLLSSQERSGTTSGDLALLLPCSLNDVRPVMGALASASPFCEAERMLTFHDSMRINEIRSEKEPWAPQPQRTLEPKDLCHLIRLDEDMMNKKMYPPLQKE